MLFGKALKNHKRSPAAYRNFPLPGYSHTRIDIFCVFWVIHSSRTLHFVLSNELMINIFFFPFLLVLSDIYSLGPF